MNTNKIFTKDNCAGCNLCISKCPCNEANVAQKENGANDGHLPRDKPRGRAFDALRGKTAGYSPGCPMPRKRGYAKYALASKHFLSSNKVYVDESKCIACGECVRICPQGARDYADDTERFFEDLKAGKNISLIVAPALRSNVPEWGRLLGYLKSVGVNTIYDTSYGADICTWAYLRYMTSNDAAGLISQPCPAIVNYIERYVPESLSRLAPIHSPAMCAAIYMKKYKNIQGCYAFLSPCVAKRDEFADPNTGGLIQYNVTFKKLLKYLEEQGVDFRKTAAVEYDNEAHGLGSVYSSPGGLKTNVEQHIQGQWIFRIEGQPRAARFLHEYASNKGDAPFIVDILSCEHGCNCGTGACREENEEYAVAKAMHKVKRESAENERDFTQFDKELQLSDFCRRYTPKKIMQIFVDRHEMENAFMAMNKPSHEFRLKDCRACGYSTCQEMAIAVAKGVNHAENCVDYIRACLKSFEESGG